MGERDARGVDEARIANRPATGRELTWPRSFETGIPAARAALRRFASLWMIFSTRSVMICLTLRFVHDPLVCVKIMTI